jgi:hypothetical protein
VSNAPRLGRLAQGLLDQDLGLRPRHQRSAVDPEGPAIEVPLPDQVLDRHAREPLHPQTLEAGRDAGIERHAGIQGQRREAAHRVGQQEPRVPGGRLRGGRGRSGGRVVEELLDGHEKKLSALSFQLSARRADV